MPIDLLSHLVGAAIRAFGLGLLAFASLLLFRIRSSAARHATWTVVLAGMLLQLPLGLIAPTVPLKTLPSSSALIQSRAMEPARISALTTETAAPASHTHTKWTGRWVLSKAIVTGAYLAISLLLFVRMAFGYLGLHRMLRGARSVPSLGPGIFESVSFVVPGSVGCFRPRILLPPDWREWGVGKLRAVLSHERAHVERRDWLIRVVSQVNVCIFWFHPLAW